MDRKSFVSEFAGIISMLKEHEFLLYTDRNEFRKKHEAACAAFVRLVEKRTELRLPADPQAVHLVNIKLPSIESAKSALKRTHRYYKAKASREKPGSETRLKYEAAAEAWDKAALLL